MTLCSSVQLQTTFYVFGLRLVFKKKISYKPVYNDSLYSSTFDLHISALVLLSLKRCHLKKKNPELPSCHSAGFRKNTEAAQEKNNCSPSGIRINGKASRYCWVGCRACSHHQERTRVGASELSAGTLEGRVSVWANWSTHYRQPEKHVLSQACTFNLMRCRYYKQWILRSKLNSWYLTMW